MGDKRKQTGLSIGYNIQEGVKWYDYDADQIYSSPWEFLMIAIRGEERKHTTLPIPKMGRDDVDGEVLIIHQGDRENAELLNAYTKAVMYAKYTF